MSVYGDQKSKIVKGILKNIFGIILWSFLAVWATDGSLWNIGCYIFNFLAIFSLISNFRKFKKVMRTEKLKKEREKVHNDFFGHNRTYRTKPNSSGSQSVYNKYNHKYQTASEYKEYLDQRIKDLYNNFSSKSKQSSQYSYKAPIRRKNGFTVTEAFKLFSLDKNSDEITIKKKYRTLVKKWHPDKWSNDTEENKKIAERNFIKVSNAYEIIKQYKN